MSAATVRRRVVAPALVLALSGCAGTDSRTSAAPAVSSPERSSAGWAPSTPVGQRIEVTVAGGQVSGDTGRVAVRAGEQVALVVTSDVAGQIHLHGYDLTAPLEPGTPAEVTFDATVRGVFEVELHEAGTVLLTLQVA